MIAFDISGERLMDEIAGNISSLRAQLGEVEALIWERRITEAAYHNLRNSWLARACVSHATWRALGAMLKEPLVQLAAGAAAEAKRWVLAAEPLR